MIYQIFQSLLYLWQKHVLCSPWFFFFYKINYQLALKNDSENLRGRH